ncbi:hypothetical protein ACFFRR_004075 [Megaselia abdita]
MPLLCRICRKGKGGKAFIHFDEPLDSENDSDSEYDSPSSVASFINSSIKGVKFQICKGKQFNKICEGCFKKLKQAYKLFKSIKESDIIFRHSNSTKIVHQRPIVEEEEDDDDSDCVVLSDSSDDEGDSKGPKTVIRLSSYNYRLNHKQLKLQHGSKDVKLVILTKLNEKRLLTLPMPTRDFTIRDILEAGNIPFHSTDHMYCEDCHLDGDFNFIVAILPEGSDKEYAEYKITKFKENRKKEEKAPSCRYCFLLRDEGVKCGRCTKAPKEDVDRYVDNNKLMALAKMISDITVKSEVKDEDKKMIKTYSPPEKRRRRR